MDSKNKIIAFGRNHYERFEFQFESYDDCYDFEVDTPEYNRARAMTRAWFDLMTVLKEKIFVVLCSEGVQIPEKGQLVVLSPFMKRNGFRNGNGWWIKEGTNIAP